MDRTLKGTRDARVTKRRDTRGFDGAQTRREELGSIFTAENNQGGGGHRSRSVSIKLNPLETIPAASAAFSTTLV